MSTHGRPCFFFLDNTCPHVVTTGQSEADRALLCRMGHAEAAGYRYGNHRRCTRGTRRDVLFQLETWLNDEQGKRVFWLNGLAGTGKSTISQTFAEMSFADGKLGASFFCSRDFSGRSKLQTIFPTLAFQLAYQCLHFREQLLPVLLTGLDIEQESLCLQIEKLIVGPFLATQISTLIIIDALDECEDDEPVSSLLSVLSHYVEKISNVKFFITGRPEPQIRSGFRLKLLQPHTDVLRLHEVGRSSVDHDIRVFLRTQLSKLIGNWSGYDIPGDWPSVQDIDGLCMKAAGFFLYASAIVRFVSSKHHLPDERLTLIISLPHGSFPEGRCGVDLLYTQILQHAFRDEGQSFFLNFRLVVGAVVLTFQSLSVKALSDLLKNCGTASRIYSTLRSLHSLLLIPDGIEEPIQIFHKSFCDFLTDPKRCADPQFFVKPTFYHRELLLSCLALMKKRLKRNICELEDYVPLREVKDLSVRRSDYIGDALGYACKFWANHLSTVPVLNFEEVDKEISEFFATCFLFWVEVLSLMEILDLGVYALKDVHQWYKIFAKAYLY